MSFFLLQQHFSIAQWKREKDSLKKRTELMNVLYQGKMYNFTGYGTWPTVDPSTEVYDPVRNNWTLLAPMPEEEAVTHQGVVLVDDKVWHIGGRLKNTDGALTSRVWIYDITRNEWSQGPELKNPATGLPILWGGGGAALIGRTIHLVGGFITNPCNNDQDNYHLTMNVDKWLTNPGKAAWENKLKPLPIKRNHISTTVLNGKMYVIGGQFGHDCRGGKDQRYSHVYNPLTDSWMQLTDLPMVRSHCEASIFPVDGKIYIAAGDGGTNLVTRLDPEANSGRGAWANLSAYTLPNSYIGSAAKVIGRRIYFSCGRLENTRNIRPETFSAPFTRNIPYKLDFLTDCFNRTIQSDKQETLTNLLYTIEGEKKYRLHSNVPWLTFKSKRTGMASQTGSYIQVTLNTNGLVPGNYKAIITAEGTGSGRSFKKASFCVTVKVTPNKSGFLLTLNKTGKGVVAKNPEKTRYNKNEKVKVIAKAAKGYRFAGWTGHISSKENPLQVVMKGNRKLTATFKRIVPPLTIVRINAGGNTQTVNGKTWKGCGSKSDCHDYVTGGFAYTQPDTPPIKGARLHDLNQAIYRSEWTGGESGTGQVAKGSTAFRYRIPVQNGSYLVRLYFVELNKNGKNLREFDIKLEGQIIYKNFDIFEAAHGMNKAIVRETPVTISDGVVNIDFIRQIQNAKVSAIEIIPLKNAILNVKPVPNAGPDRVLTANESGIAKITLNGSASTDKDGYLIGHHWILDGQHLGNDVTQALTLDVGTHNVRLVVKDNAGASRYTTVTIVVKPGIQNKEELIVTGKEVIAQPEKGIVPLPETEQLTLKVYPNPAISGDRTFIQITNAVKQETVTITVYDMQGRSILSTSLLTNAFGQASTELQLTDKVSLGTYIIKAYGSSHSAQTKITIR